MEHARTVAVGAAGVAALAAAFGLLGGGSSASGSLLSPPTTIVATSGSSTSSSANSPVAKDVSAQLPTGFTVGSVADLVGTRSNYSDLDARRPDGSGYEVTIYKVFAASELADLVKAPAASGTAWIGATDRDLTSVYYRSADGVGLWVGSYSPLGRPDSVSQLVDLAARVAALPSVKTQALS